VINIFHLQFLRVKLATKCWKYFYDRKPNSPNWHCKECTDSSLENFLVDVKNISFIFFFLKGAKNHGVIMPDANKENTINQVCGHI